jgi:hypothetical protein
MNYRCSKPIKTMNYNDFVNIIDTVFNKQLDEVELIEAVVVRDGGSVKFTTNCISDEGFRAYFFYDITIHKLVGDLDGDDEVEREIYEDEQLVKFLFKLIYQSKDKFNDTIKFSKMFSITLSIMESYPFLSNYVLNEIPDNTVITNVVGVADLGSLLFYTNLKTPEGVAISFNYDYPDGLFVSSFKSNRFVYRDENIVIKLFNLVKHKLDERDFKKLLTNYPYLNE